MYIIHQRILAKYMSDPVLKLTTNSNKTEQTLKQASLINPVQCNRKKSNHEL